MSRKVQHFGHRVAVEALRHLGRVLWKRTGVVVVLAAALILLVLVFAGPMIWAARTLWRKASAIGAFSRKKHA